MTEEQREEIRRVRQECDEALEQDVRDMLGTCCRDYWRRKCGLADDGSSIVVLVENSM